MEVTDRQEFAEKTQQFLAAAKGSEHTAEFARNFECEYASEHTVHDT